MDHSLESESDWDFSNKSKPHWSCEECGHKDYTKPLPKDQETFNKRKKM